MDGNRDGCGHRNGCGHRDGWHREVTGVDVGTGSVRTGTRPHHGSILLITCQGPLIVNDPSSRLPPELQLLQGSFGTAGHCHCQFCHPNLRDQSCHTCVPSVGSPHAPSRDPTASIPQPELPSGPGWQTPLRAAGRGRGGQARAKELIRKGQMWHIPLWAHPAPGGPCRNWNCAFLACHLSIPFPLHGFLPLGP